MNGHARHVMLDLETLSSSKDAAIIQVAAVVFDPSTGEHMAQFDAVSSDLVGRVNPKTVAWWMQQKQAAKLGARISSEGIPTKRVLADFIEWFRGLGPVEAIWSHGATFDLPVMCSALAACDLEQPWHYRAERDTRTLYALAPGGMPEVVRDEDQVHDALYDCKLQIAQVVGALRALRVFREVA